MNEYAPTPCIEPNCFKMVVKKGRCAKHQLPAYITNYRNDRLPSDWNTRRQIVLRRDKHICYICQEAKATEVDHIVNETDDHSLENLAAVCKECHSKKTNREAQEAKQRMRTKMSYRKFM